MQEILQNYSSKSDAIQILQDVQKKYGYISKENLQIISKSIKVPYAELYAIITFYKSFSLEKKGKHLIRMCDGTACHIKGSTDLIDIVKEKLAIKVGETTKDGKFSLETVACMGVCALAPVMVIDGKYYGNLDRSSLLKILNDYSREDEI